MLRRLWPAGLGLLLVGLVVAPETAGTGTETGYASSYAPGVFEDVVRYRLDNDLWRVSPPWDWYYQVKGYAAGTDCARVGEVTTLRDSGGREYVVLYADCAGDAATMAWMLTNNIVAELDAALFDKLAAAHGRPLEVEWGSE